MLDLIRLAHVVTIAREGNYNAAAASIPLSQSTLTRSVQAVESQYGIQIFERGRFGARLTEEGADFVEMAEHVLRRSEADSDALAAFGRHGPRTVRFGMGSIAAALFLPRLLRQLDASVSGVRVVVESNDGLRALLRSGQIDFFLGGIPRESDGFAAAHHFLVSRVPGGDLCALVRPGHPLVDSRDRSALPAFPVAAGAFIRDLDIDRILPGIRTRGPALEMDNYDFLARLAGETDHVVIGSAFLPVIRPEFGLVRVPGSDIRELPLDWGLVRAAQRRSPEGALRVAQSLLSLVNESLVAQDPQP